jgi:hypothetical protein
VGISLLGCAPAATASVVAATSSVAAAIAAASAAVVATAASVAALAATPAASRTTTAATATSRRSALLGDGRVLLHHVDHLRVPTHHHHTITPHGERGV